MKYDNNEVIHRKINDIEILQFKELLKYNNDLIQFYTLRHGGNSINEYNSLNLGLFVNDDINIVKQNYSKILSEFNITSSSVFIPKQIHSDKTIIIDNTNNGTLNNENFIECDGEMTNKPSIMLVTNSADCMTVTIYDSIKKCVANVHSGWKGIVNRIVIKSIDRMIEEYDSAVNDLVVCVGPSLCKNCFEVCDDVKDIFVKEFEKEIYNKHNIINKIENDDKYIIDLPEILRVLLLNKGIKSNNIHFSGICTKCNYMDFYSYRHNDVTGRMGNFVMLK